jgi:hypothetical protein
MANTPTSAPDMRFPLSAKDASLRCHTGAQTCWRLAVTLLFWMPSNLPAAAPEPSVSTPGQQSALQSLRRELLEHYAKLRSFKATIRTRGTQDPTDEHTLILRAKGISRFELAWHGSWDKSADDPRTYVRFYNGSDFNIFNYHTLRYDISKRFACRPYTDKVASNMLLESLGWWPPDDTTPPLKSKGEPCFLVDICRDSRLVLRATREKVDGQDCHVMEIPHITRLWVDPSLCVLRRRDELRPISDDRTDVLCSMTFRNHRNYGEGIWLPTRIVRVFPGNQLGTTTHQIEYGEVNAVRDETFAFEPPPGTLIFDRDRDELRQIPGGLEHLDLLSRRVLLQTNDRRESHGVVSWRQSAAMLSAFCGGFSVGLILWLRRHWFEGIGAH